MSGDVSLVGFQEPGNPKYLTCKSCFVSVFVLRGGGAYLFDRGTCSFVKHAIGKADEISQTPRVIKMLHTLFERRTIIFTYLETKMQQNKEKGGRSELAEGGIRVPAHPPAMPGGLNVELTVSISISLRIMGFRN